MISKQTHLAEHRIHLRVRYSETDQMGTFYNSRALEWFECGRTELLRAAGVPYAEMEARGVLLPLIEAHVEYFGRARYDDLLEMTTRAAFCGKARLRFDVEIVHAPSEQSRADCAPAARRIARGYTVHAISDAAGKPIRPPDWLLTALPQEGRA
ncbi:MAG: acyl-CoA thioesterase [Phycisphaerae bacterium]|nr:acyl-CoA thioesterase [Phycisphaerae bacterium]